MGYRSEVMMCLRKEDFEKLKEKVRKIKCEDNKLMEKNNFDKYVYYSKDNVVVFGWNSLKWYGGYEIVELVREYLEMLSNNDVEYKFVRIGEDYGDIEINENYIEGICDHINIIQDIEII